MSKTALWDVSSSLPKRLSVAAVDLEQQLEGWIESDPSLLQSGLEIIGRQLSLEAGRLDLLAMDQQARLCLIEIKRGTLMRDTVAQALDYAGSLMSVGAEQLRELIDGYLAKHKHNKSAASMLAERRELEALDVGKRQVVLFVVGVGSDSGLSRVASFLARYEVPLNIVSYDVFSTEDNRLILSREVTETEAPLSASSAWQPASSLEVLQKQADDNGIGAEFKTMLDAGLQAGLYPRLWTTKVMLAPQANKSRALYTIDTRPKDGLLQAWVGSAVFSEFFPISVEHARMHLGSDGWRQLDQEQAAKFAEGMNALFKNDGGDSASQQEG